MISSSLEGDEFKSTKKRREDELEEEEDTDDQYEEKFESKRMEGRRKSKLPSSDINTRTSRPILIPNEKRKAYYPVIDLSSTQLELAVSSKEEKERDILCRVVEEVCALEQQELRQYFERSYPEKKPLLQSLENILTSLPKYLDMKMPEDISFKSEYSSSEKTELFELRTIVQNQKSVYEELLKYEADPQLFLKEYGIPVKKADGDQTATYDPVSSEILCYVILM